MKIALKIVLLVLVGNSSWAQKIEKAFQVIDPQKDVLKKISKSSGFIVDHVSRNGFELYGPASIVQFLENQNVVFYEIEQKQNKLDADYPSPETVINRMKSLQTRFPQLITLIEIGKSNEGRSLMVARITAPEKMGVKSKKDRPEFKYVANMHGDEIVGRELMLKFIEDLSTNYGKDNQITRILDQVQVYVMPSLNPDGAARHTRANANGVDLNRSFPDFTTPDNQNTSSDREPEIQAMMSFQRQHRFLLSANFHGGAEVVNYPYDTTADIFPLDSLVKSMSFNYAKNVPYIFNSNEFKNGITNGYQWYEVDGGMQDWSYHWHGDLQVTIELSNQKWPSYSTIDGYYRANRPGLLGFIEEIGRI
jgi:hypothetical protein